MAEYIERKTALEAIRNLYPGIPFTKRLMQKWHEENKNFMQCESAIEKLPAADVVPVRHGRWQITDAYPHNVYCSECHTRFAQTHWEVWEDGSLPRAYCPNCGAKMDGEA